MKYANVLGLILVVLLAVGIGANPRLIEELRIGGGFGEEVDGGADFEKDGTIKTDGTVTAAGFAGDGSALSGVQLHDADLDAIAGLQAPQGQMLVGNGSVWNALPAGLDGQRLESDSSVGLGVRWSTPAGGASLPVDDTTALVRDPVDPTREVRLDAGAVAAGTTRTIAMADQDIDLAPDTGSFQGADPATAKTDTAQAWSRAQVFDAATLTDAAAIAWDLEAGQVASVTLGGDRTLSNPSNAADGGTYVLIVRQDATGGRSLSFGSAYKWPGGTAPVLSTAANAVDVITFVSDGASLFGVCAKGFE